MFGEGSREDRHSLKVRDPATFSETVRRSREDHDGIDGSDAVVGEDRSGVGSTIRDEQGARE